MGRDPEDSWQTAIIVGAASAALAVLLIILFLPRILDAVF